MSGLEGPAILALITVFGIGMVTGALLLGAIIIATVVVVKMGGGKFPSGVDPSVLAALDKAARTVGPELEAFITAVNAAKGGKSA